MKETATHKKIRPNPRVRLLKIEEVGDFWKGLIKPRIRLVGIWLKSAGFKPGYRVHVSCIEPGVIELRCGRALANTLPLFEHNFMVAFISLQQ
jgi:hypothetical protein